MPQEASNANTEKAFGITNIKSFVSVTLDFEELNFNQWKELIEMVCITHEVDGHLDGTKQPTGPDDKAWTKVDTLIKMWIYNTVSNPILQMIMKRGLTARQVWKTLDDLFQSNKSAKAMQLNEDLRNIRIGDLTITEYCH